MSVLAQIAGKRGWRVPRLALFFVAITLPAALCTGCLHVIAQDTPYYQEGPRQERPPEGELPAGTGVWIIGAKDGYQGVWADNGVIGYVWPRAIKTRAEWEQMKKTANESAEDKTPQAAPPPEPKHP